MMIFSFILKKKIGIMICFEEYYFEEIRYFVNGCITRILMSLPVKPPALSYIIFSISNFGTSI